jgi:hypothetical protein
MEASDRSLPGQLPGTDGTAASRRGSAAVTATTWAAHAPSPPPPPPPARVPHLGSIQQLLVGFGNTAYFDLVRNWAATVAPLEDTPYLIAGEPLLSRNNGVA